jgi:hypothetical protein
MTKIISTICLFLLISCGKAVEDKNEEAFPEEETFPDGNYTAVLIPINGRVTNQIDGEVKISLYGDDFKVKVQIKNSPGGIHKQFLHGGNGCPSQTHDDNRDGYIDGYEAREVMGMILVPFDGDLSAQFSGDSFFPSGSYSYARSTSYYLMLSDLHLPDEVLNDSIAKLKERDLPLENRAVSIFGKSAVGDIPIACGILTRVSDVPLPDNDEWTERYPGPGVPNPSPRPRPRPDPLPRPDDHDSQSWWDRIRGRWDHWWNGSGN